MGQLVPAFVDHLGVCHHKAVFYSVFVEFSSRVGVRHRNLDGLDIKFFGEVDGLADRLSRFPGQAQNEVAVDDQAQLVTILGELAGTLDGGPLLDILQDLLVP